MESLPSELATAIFETLGFHHRPAAQAVSKSWRGLDALVESRARHRATVASFPPPPPDNEFGRGGEFVALRPRAYGDATYVVDVSLDDFSMPARVVLRTDANQNAFFDYVVEIDANGSAAVYDYEDPSATVYESPEGYTSFTRRNAVEFFASTNLKNLKLLARYECVGFFLGMSKLDHRTGRKGFSQYGDSILLQLPCTISSSNDAEKRPIYHYVFVGGEITQFQLSQPVTRFFANIANNHAQSSIALTADEAIYLRGVPLRVPRDVLLREPRSAMNPLPTNAAWFADYGEEAFELFMLRTGGNYYGVTGDVRLLRPEDAGRPEAARFDSYPTVHQDPPVNSLTAGELAEERRQMIERIMRFRGGL